MSAVLDLPKITDSQTSVRGKIETNVVERVILHNVSWETYEKLLAENQDVANPHFSYCDGDLEIMVLGYQHEVLKHRLSELLVEIARVLEIDYEGAASTTFRREKKRKGFEGDGTFYFKNAEFVRTKNKIDLSKDPPPELVIEIDITHGSLPKFPIFADLGIEEIWRFDGSEVKFYRLQNQDFGKVSESICLPGVKSEAVTKLLFAAQEMKRLDWIKLIHQKVKK